VHFERVFFAQLEVDTDEVRVTRYTSIRRQSVVWPEACWSPREAFGCCLLEAEVLLGLATGTTVYLRRQGGALSSRGIVGLFLSPSTCEVDSGGIYQGKHSKSQDPGALAMCNAVPSSPRYTVTGVPRS
jgi:hypothetical protein